MTQSPGHQQWPEHKVQEKGLEKRVEVQVSGQTVADSVAAIEVDEDDHQPRYYMPRQDVDTAKLSDSNTTSSCPFKGEARYYNLNFGVKELQDVAWSYNDPYDEHRALKGRIAFHDEIPELDIRIH